MADLPYKTLDHLADLLPGTMALARPMTFTPYSSPGVGWDYTAQVYETDDYAILHDKYSITFIKGAKYDIFSMSFFDPFILILYDQFGNAIATNNELYDHEYGYDEIRNFIAPYSGTYYISASWNQGAAQSHKEHLLFVWEDRDTIIPNRAPTVSGTLTPLKWTEGQPGQYIFPATTFTDPDGDALTYSALLADGSALPSWLSFNAATRTFTGTPPTDAADVTIVITARDPAGLTATQTLNLSTPAANRAPTVAQSVSQGSLAEGTPGVFTIPAGTFSDPDGDALTYSVRLASGAPLPSWLTFNGSIRTLIGTPPTDTGDLQLTVTATDPAGLTASTTFTLTTPASPRALVTAASAAILRGATDGNVVSLIEQAAVGLVSVPFAVAQLVSKADTTTSVATLSYQFFTGKIPGEGGIDYLVSTSGPNANNLNSSYYQTFNLENRYINFAVNLGKQGEGRTKFEAEYGALTLEQATKKAYGVIFGATPTDAKVAALLAGGRDAYLETYGRDGHNGLGTKAAMVGWLLAEAEKADLGMYTRSNAAFLTDIADGGNWAIDLVGVYGKPEFVYTG